MFNKIFKNTYNLNVISIHILFFDFDIIYITF